MLQTECADCRHCGKDTIASILSSCCEPSAVTVSMNAIVTDSEEAKRIITATLRERKAPSVDCAAGTSCINRTFHSKGKQGPTLRPKKLWLTPLVARHARGETGLPVICATCERLLCGIDCIALHKCAGKVSSDNVI